MSATYSVPETAALLGFATSTLYQQVREGRADHLKPIRLGTKTRFPKSHIDRLAGIDRKDAA